MYAVGDFDELDGDHSGSVDREELQRALERKLGTSFVLHG
jgi:hypothetical protein